MNAGIRPILLIFLASSWLYAGDVAVDAISRFKGSFGMNVCLDGSGNGFLTDGSPTSDRFFDARFYLHTSDLNLSDGESTTVFAAFDGGGQQELAIKVQRSGANHLLQIEARTDGGAQSSLIPANRPVLSNGWSAIEIDWRAASAAGVNDGAMNLFVNGVQQGSITGVDNDTAVLDSMRIGVVEEPTTTPAGIILIDDFQAYRAVARIGTLCITSDEFNAFYQDWPNVNMLRLLEYFPHKCDDPM